MSVSSYFLLPCVRSVRIELLWCQQRHPIRWKRPSKGDTRKKAETRRARRNSTLLHMLDFSKGSKGSLITRLLARLSALKACTSVESLILESLHESNEKVEKGAWMYQKRAQRLRWSLEGSWSINLSEDVLLQGFFLPVRFAGPYRTDMICKLESSMPI